MKEDKPVVVGIGELLWDVLPTGKRAGGAPVNFVYHAARLGAEGYAVSAVGNDVSGTEIVQELDKNGICHSLGTVEYPTGSVMVYDHRRCRLGPYTFDSGSRCLGGKSGCRLFRHVGATFVRITYDDPYAAFACPRRGTPVL